MWKKLIDWSKREFSDLPWRQDRTMYTTLVSEIMLQQTTVGTVLNHFDRFLKKYPNVKSLASTTEEQITIDWKGLGYYRRARNLRKAAIEIQKRFSGEFPLEYETLISIAGIGDYTASALLSMGSSQDFLAIDANLERVLSRLFLLEEEKGPKLISRCKKLTEESSLKRALKKYGAGDINEALMDLGRVYCQARRTDCLLCPMQPSCQAYQSGRDVLSFPKMKEKKAKESFELSLLRVVAKKRSQLLGYQKNDQEWLSGQIEIPTFVIQTNDKNFSQYPKLIKKLDFKKLPLVKTTITKYKISNYILECTEEEFKSLSRSKRYRWLNEKECDALSTASLKVLKKIPS